MIYGNKVLLQFFCLGWLPRPKIKNNHFLENVSGNMAEMTWETIMTCSIKHAQMKRKGSMGLSSGDNKLT
jgi:hypothetical protein